MTTMIDMCSPWEVMNTLSRAVCEEFEDQFKRLRDNGLKSIIQRPHNLINIQNDEGEVTAQRLEVCTTPFARDDVKLSVNDGMLVVKCGTENASLGDNEVAVYRGISGQTYQFSLKLSPNIDKDKITATNKDGVLKVTMPFKQVENKNIEISLD